MDTKDNKIRNEEPQGLIEAHEEEKRLMAHESDTSMREAAAAGVAAGASANKANASTDAGDDDGFVMPEKVTNNGTAVKIARVLGVLCIAALVGLISIFVYKGVVGDDYGDRYVASTKAPAIGFKHDKMQGKLQDRMQGNAKAAAAISPVAAQALASKRPVIVYLFNLDSQGVGNQKALDQLAKSVSGTNDILLIDAYTDPSGSDAYNQALSQRRAQALANYFVSHGVPASHIQAVGHGKTDKYGSPELDRRAEITIK